MYIDQKLCKYQNICLIVYLITEIVVVFFHYFLKCLFIRNLGDYRPICGSRLRKMALLPLSLNGETLMAVLGSSMCLDRLLRFDLYMLYTK